MRSEDERRATTATRIPFEGLVEVGGAVGPAFEAQAVDVSDGGIHMRTAYLPEVGQRLSCRFDAGPSSSVLASGEVIWRREQGRGGEFGLRFEDLDEESAQALRHITGAAVTVTKLPAQAPGSKVRLHIEGLGAPMRAKVRSSKDNAVIVGSELGFLRVGKDLDLEDAGTGEKRPARIDSVEVEVDGSSKVPNLVVTLKYSDQAGESVAHDGGAKDRTPGPSELAAKSTSHTPRAKRDEDDDDLEAIRRASGGVRGAFARGTAQVAPAISKFAKRARVTVALLASRAKSAAQEGAVAPIRRTTAKAPGGGLHTSGRKVVRGDSMNSEMDDGFVPSKHKVDKRKLAIGGAIGAAVLLTAIAMRKPAEPPPAAGASSAESALPASSAATAVAAPGAAGADPASLAGTPGAPPAVAPPAAIVMPPATITPGPEVSESTIETSDGKANHGRRAMPVQPFGNGPVAHGNVLKLKMDGAIEKIQGASQPTGFTVVVPNRRSLEAAGPLAARDSRIATIRVTNDPNGAELSLTFKDGVPNYQVRGKGDTLEIALAPLGAIAEAKPEGKPAPNGRLPGKHADAKRGHGKHHGHGHGKTH